MCLRINRSGHSDFQRYASNNILYNKAEIPRIDNFTIKLTRDYFSSLHLIDNTIIQSIKEHPIHSPEYQINSGYTTPQSFSFCDSRGLVQCGKNIPLLYHWRRNKANKRISFTLQDIAHNSENFIGAKDIPSKDYNDFHRLKFEKYSWLSFNCPHMRELNERKQAWNRRRERIRS